MEFCTLQTKETRSQLFSPTQLLVDDGTIATQVRKCCFSEGKYCQAQNITMTVRTHSLLEGNGDQKYEGVHHRPGREDLQGGPENR
jgi:hypothetical protein